MLNTSAVVTAVGAALATKYTDSTVYLNDVPKGFKRPSFFVAERQRAVRQINFALCMVTLTVVVACFVERDSYQDIDRAELTGRTDGVTALFSSAAIAVDGRHLLVQSTRISQDDLQEVELVFEYADDVRTGQQAKENAGDIAMRVVANKEEIPIIEIKDKEEG